MSTEIWDILVVGETYHPVPQFITNWICRIPDESEFQLPHIDELPIEVLSFCELEEGDEEADIILSNFGWDNERAMFITGYTECFSDINEVNEFMKENQYEFGEELHFNDY